MKNKKIFVHKFSVIDKNVEIGINTKIWYFSHIQSGAKIGNNCSIGQNVNISNNVTIGNFCKIQNNVSIYEGVTIEDDVFCGPSCVFTNDLTPRAKFPKGRENYKKTTVRKGATIGANATIVCGHTIGEYSLIGSGAVVTKDVVPYGIYIGVPARLSGWVCECGEILSLNNTYSVNDFFICKKCGKKFKINEKFLLQELK